jgi:predicted ATPase
VAANLAMGARLLSLLGDNKALDERAGQMFAVAGEQGFPFYRALGTIYRGWSRALGGDVAEGISLLRSGLNDHTATGTETQKPFYLALLAKACAIGKQFAEALSLVDEALHIAERIEERWFEAELHRHKGQLMLRQGQPEAAEEFYRKALSIAEGQEAKLWELRAAVSLARLYREQGRRAEARELLTAVYGWFSEGFDARDLKDANALLYS